MRIKLSFLSILTVGLLLAPCNFILADSQKVVKVGSVEKKNSVARNLKIYVLWGATYTSLIILSVATGTPVNYEFGDIAKEFKSLLAESDHIVN